MSLRMIVVLQPVSWDPAGIAYRSEAIGAPARRTAVARPELPNVQAKGRARPGATVRARMPSVARSAPSGMTGKMATSFQLWSTDDQS